MTIEEAIRNDHVVLRRMLREVRSQREAQSGELDRTYRLLRALSAVHMQGEEDFFYAELTKDPASRADALQSLEEHRLLRGLERDLDGLEPADELWEARFAVYEELAIRHFDGEEDTLFVEVLQEASDARRRELGERFEQRKKMARFLEPVAT